MKTGINTELILHTAIEDIILLNDYIMYCEIL